MEREKDQRDVSDSDKLKIALLFGSIILIILIILGLAFKYRDKLLKLLSISQNSMNPSQDMSCERTVDNKDLG